MNSNDAINIDTKCYTVSAIPRDHPEIRHFQLFVIRTNPQLGDDSWIVSDSWDGSPRHFLSDKQEWHYGISDYDPFFGKVEPSLWTEEQEKRAAELRTQFRTEHYFSESQALRLAVEYAPHVRVQTYTVAMALADYAAHKHN
jgi:hypothetical protein